MKTKPLYFYSELFASQKIPQKYIISTRIVTNVGKMQNAKYSRRISD